MKKINNEFKVGFFVLLCILGLIYLVFSTGKVSFKKDGYYIYAAFNDIAGLDKKAPVMLNGLEVGKVEDIKVSYDDDKTRILLKIWLEKKAKVRQNAKVSIKTLGLMGEKYIQISSIEGNGFISPETVLEGMPYLDLDAIMEQAQGITRSLNLTLDNNKDTITQILKNLEISTEYFKEFSDDIRKHPWKLLFKGKEKK